MVESTGKVPKSCQCQMIASRRVPVRFVTPSKAFAFHSLTHEHISGALRATPAEVFDRVHLPFPSVQSSPARPCRAKCKSRENNKKRISLSFFCLVVLFFIPPHWGLISHPLELTLKQPASKWWWKKKTNGQTPPFSHAKRRSPTPSGSILFSLDLPSQPTVVRHHRPPHTSTTSHPVRSRSSTGPSILVLPKATHAQAQEINPAGRALTVRLLEAGTGTWTTELLGLATAVVGNEEGTVELGQSLLQQVLGVLIDEPISKGLVIKKVAKLPAIVFVLCDGSRAHRISRGSGVGDRTSGCRQSEPWRWPVAQRCFGKC